MKVKARHGRHAEAEAWGAKGRVGRHAETAAWTGLNFLVLPAVPQDKPPP